MKPGEALLHEAQRVLVGGALANNAQLIDIDGEWVIQGDPTEAAFLVAQHKLEGAAGRAARYERQAEVPFTSERKMMSVLAQDALGEVTRLFTKGAPDILLARCEAIQVGTASVDLDQPRGLRRSRRSSASLDRGTGRSGSPIEPSTKRTRSWPATSTSRPSTTSSTSVSSASSIRRASRQKRR